jgi:hypothetical protein
MSISLRSSSNFWSSYAAIPSTTSPPLNAASAMYESLASRRLRYSARGRLPLYVSGSWKPWPNVDSKRFQLVVGSELVNVNGGRIRHQMLLT